MRFIIAAAAALAAGTPLSAQPAATPVSAQPAPAAAAAPDYSLDAAWLCLPGASDVCSRPLGTAALNPNGYGSVGQVVPAKNPPADCFYVYPTVSRDPGLSSDLSPGPEEAAAALTQLARFGTVCRPLAPANRQATPASIPRALAGENVQPAFALAYGDVLAAWRDFVARRNQGRPFVLIGHSQGSILLSKLVAEEIDGKPISRKMLSAMLLGWTVEVPQGKTVGGTFKATPLCTRAGETGCVITYMSFRADAPPPAGALFGRAPRPGMTAGCTNPAALAGGSAPLDSYWFTKEPPRPGGQVIPWSREGAPPTPFLRTEGMVSAACVHDGQAGYLAVTVNADPADARTDTIPGDIYMLGKINPGWGLHRIDVNVAQGDLIRLVEAQTSALGSKTSN